MTSVKNFLVLTSRKFSKQVNLLKAKNPLKRPPKTVTGSPGDDSPATTRAPKDYHQCVDRHQATKLVGNNGTVSIYSPADAARYVQYNKLRGATVSRLVKDAQSLKSAGKSADAYLYMLLAQILKSPSSMHALKTLNQSNEFEKKLAGSINRSIDDPESLLSTDWDAMYHRLLRFNQDEASLANAQADYLIYTEGADTFNPKARHNKFHRKTQKTVNEIRKGARQNRRTLPFEVDLLHQMNSELAPLLKTIQVLDTPGANSLGNLIIHEIVKQTQGGHIKGGKVINELKSDSVRDLQLGFEQVSPSKLKLALIRALENYSSLPLESEGVSAYTKRAEILDESKEINKMPQEELVRILLSRKHPKQREIIFQLQRSMSNYGLAEPSLESADFHNDELVTDLYRGVPNKYNDKRLAIETQLLKHRLIDALNKAINDPSFRKKISPRFTRAHLDDCVELVKVLNSQYGDMNIKPAGDIPLFEPVPPSLRKSLESYAGLTGKTLLAKS